MVSTPDSLFVKSLAPPYASTLALAEINCFVHVLRESDGSGGLTSSAVDSLVAGAFADLWTLNVFPTVVGLSYLDNSNYYADPDGNAASVFLQDSHSDAVDIYLGPAVGPAKGRADGIPGSALVLAGVLDSPSALSHLLGSCLGLYVTSESAFGVEMADGSNGTTAGDLVADTAADPGLFGWVQSDCSIAADSLAAYPGYSPDPTNIMSRGRMTCWSGFTAGQQSRVLAMIESSAVLQAVIPVPDPQYVDVTAATLLRTLSKFPADPTNAVVFSFTGVDSWKDLLAAGNSSVSADPNRGFAGRCDGYTPSGVPYFVGVTLAAFPNDSRPPNGTHGLVAADYDNDGYIDFYAPNPDYDEVGSNPGFTHRLYRNTGGGSFTDETVNVGLANLPDYRDATLSSAWGDYDSDGFLDLLVVVAPTSVSRGGIYDARYLRLFRNIPDPAHPGQRDFMDVTVSSGLGTSDEYVNSCLWIDMDQDHDMDLVTVQHHETQLPGHTPGPSYSRYYMNEAGHFTDVTSTHMSVTDELTFGGTFAAHGDFDNDGDIDIVYHGQEYRGWLRNTFTGPPGSAVLQYGWSTNQGNNNNFEGWPATPQDLDVFDIDLDGNLDFATSNSDQNLWPEGMFRNLTGSDAFQFINGSGISATHSRGLGAADYNLDGYMELLMTTYDNHAVTPFFYKAKPVVDGTATNNWVGIRLEADTGEIPCNFRGIGATVIVAAGSHTQAQVVDGGSGGQGGQHDLDLSFGLGAYADSVDVEIVWPCGQTQYTRVAPNQLNTIALSVPQIDDTSVRGYMSWAPGQSSTAWVFEWKTSDPGDDELDRVDFPYGIPGYSGVSFLDHDTSGTSWSVVYQAGGNYLHTVTWSGHPCDENLNFYYKVRSGVLASESLSLRKRFSVFACIISE